MSSIQMAYSSLDDAQKKLLIAIAKLCDHAGNLTEEAAEEVLRITVSDVNTYQYLCQNGLVRARAMGVGFGLATGLTPQGLACLAAIKGEGG